MSYCKIPRQLLQYCVKGITAEMRALLSDTEEWRTRTGLLILSKDYQELCAAVNSPNIVDGVVVTLTEAEEASLRYCFEEKTGETLGELVLKAMLAGIAQEEITIQAGGGKYKHARIAALKE